MKLKRSEKISSIESTEEVCLPKFFSRDITAGSATNGNGFQFASQSTWWATRPTTRGNHMQTCSRLYRGDSAEWSETSFDNISGLRCWMVKRISSRAYSYLRNHAWLYGTRLGQGIHPFIGVLWQLTLPFLLPKCGITGENFPISDRSFHWFGSWKGSLIYGGALIRNINRQFV